MSTTVDVTKEIIKNAAMAVPAVRRWRLGRPRAGARFTGEDAELRRYAFQGLESLQQITGGVEGQSICEIGPGDFLTSGLAMLAAGATSYTAIDRFVGDYSCLEGKEWYTGIQEAWPRIYPNLPWPAWLDASRFPEGYPDQVMTSGVRIESVQGIGPFDVVCSFQVGEHVSDINEFARSTATLLKLRGVAVHRIDFGPHGVWRSCRDPLTFLRIPGPLWRAMGSARGTPNRCRANEMEDAFQAAGLSVKSAEVERYLASATDLSRLPARYKQMPLEPLLIKTVVLVARHTTST
jgi:Methyltransferase domain